MILDPAGYHPGANSQRLVFLPPPTAKLETRKMPSLSFYVVDIFSGLYLPICYSPRQNFVLEGLLVDCIFCISSWIQKIMMCVTTYEMSGIFPAAVG